MHLWRLARRSSLLPALAAVLLVPAATAHAGATLVLPDGTPAAQEQAWLEEAVAPSPSTVVTVHRELCPGTGGRACAMVDSPDIYVAGDADWPWNEANTRKDALLHEVGHMLDRPWTGFPDAARDEFRALIGDDRPWRTSPDSPHEKFAEAWRLCALGEADRSGRGVFGGYDYRPSPEVHRQVCALIAREGAALGWTAGSQPAPAGEPPARGGSPALGASEPAAPVAGRRAAPTARGDALALHGGVLGTRASGRLTARAARAAVRAAVRRRVPGLRRVGVVCGRLAARRLRCRFAARHGPMRYAGQGTVTRATGAARVRYRLSVTVTPLRRPGPSRRTAWSG